MDLNKVNEDAKEKLLDVFDKVFTHDNLLILDQNLSPLINFLIPFKQFKQRGKFEKIVWIKDATIDKSQYQNFVVLTENMDFDLPEHGRITLIIKNLTKSKLYQLNKRFKLNLTFDNIIENKLVNIRSNQLRVFNWDFQGLQVDEDVISLYDTNSLGTYFNNPLLVVNNLNDALLNLIKSYNIKINNIYCQGVNSNLLLKLYQKNLHEYLSENFNNLQQEFYLNNLQGDFNLIILERNLDFLPIVMNQINYIGLINDLLDYQINIVKVPEGSSGTRSIKFTDELFDKLKYLNFSLIGNKLNQLARLIKDQYNSNSDINIQEMKHLVENLTDLNHQQELIKKHTQISELLLDKIKINGDKKFNEFEIFLTFCNEVFQLSYKQQIQQVHEFLLQNLSEVIILNCLILVSIINSNIKEKDFELLKQECFQAFGISVIYKLDKLMSLSLININDWDPNPNTSIQEGITGGINMYKNNYTLLNKFWNSHPEEEAEPSPDTYNQSLPSNTIPLTVRLIESLFSREFLTYKPVNKITRLPSWENLGLEKMFKGKTTEIITTKGTTHLNQNTILMFLGGITWSEISCIKTLNEKLHKKGLNKQFIIVTNSIVNNNHLMESVSLNC